MKPGMICSAAILAAAIALPAQAQEGALSEGRVELYAEMLAMGTACREVPGIRIREERLYDWMTSELAQGPESDLERVLALRDSKLLEMQEQTAEVNALPRGNRRSDAINEHYARSLQRCMRMTRNSLAEEYFIRL